VSKSLKEKLSEIRDDLIRTSLKVHRGVVPKAASALGMTTRGLNMWLLRNKVNHRIYWTKEYFKKNHRRGRPREWLDNHDD
jgi:hypothetical protein